MEFIIFLSKLDKEIFDLLIKANYKVEENRIECLLNKEIKGLHNFCLLYTSPSPRDLRLSRMPSSA